MIGIQNADGVISWILQDEEEGLARVRISPVRHGQSRMHIPLYTKGPSGLQRRLGELRFKTRFEGFLERPELETRVRLDSRGRVHISVDHEGRLIQGRFQLGRSFEFPKFRIGLEKLTWIFFALGSVCFLAAILLLVFPGLRGA